MADVNTIRNFYIVKDKKRFIFFLNGAIYILNLNNSSYKVILNILELIMELLI